MRAWWLMTVGALMSLECRVAAEPAGELRKSSGGRVLYAGDDDWDWVSPLGAKNRSGLSRYGAMPWSALDWAEEGLEEVRGALVGSPPTIGDYLSIDELNDLRGERATYRHIPQNGGKLAELLKSKPAPNLLIFMQDTGNEGPPSPEQEQQLLDFVRGGGRLLILDDWAHYHKLLESMVDNALESPPIPILPEEEEPPPAADAELVARVEALVRDLGDPAFHKREAAMAEIRKLGNPALQLAAEMKVDDPEISARLAQLLKNDAEENPEALHPGKPGDPNHRLKHMEAEKRISRAAEKLKGVGFPHKIDDVFVNSKGIRIPALKLEFPPPAKQ